MRVELPLGGHRGRRRRRGVGLAGSGGGLDELESPRLHVAGVLLLKALDELRVSVLLIQGVFVLDGRRSDLCDGLSQLLLAGLVPWEPLLERDGQVPPVRQKQQRSVRPMVESSNGLKREYWCKI